MQQPRMQKKWISPPGLKGFGLGALAVSLMAVVWVSLYGLTEAASRTSIVVFSAKWCASCREVTPIVQEIGQQNGIQVQEIDVDAQNAPAQARTYGLSIPSGNLPQVYLVQGGTSSVLFDGSNYRMGRGQIVRTTVLQNLQRGLGSSSAASGK